MKKISMTLFAFILCTVCFAKDIILPDFKIVKKQDDITLYERWIKRGTTEPVRELKAEFLVECDIENVISLLKDQPAGIKWNKNASLYKIANTPKNNEWINYIKYNMPAMFDDQECCLLYKMPDSYSINENACVINFESTTSSLFPPQSAIKRITGVSGQWKMEQLPNNILKITYRISSDKSANIPRFISDPIVHSNLIKTMLNFKTMLEK